MGHFDIDSKWIEKNAEAMIKRKKPKSVKFKDMKYRYGFISPDGRLYECPHACHTLLAQTICNGFGYDIKDALIELEKKEWIKISGWNFMFDFVPTKLQIDKICEYANTIGEDKSFRHNGIFKSYVVFLKEIS